MADETASLNLQVNGAEQFFAAARAVESADKALEHYLATMRAGATTTAAVTSAQAALVSQSVAARGGLANMGQGLMQVAQFADDAQYGLRAVVNQIPLLLTSFGAGAGLAGGVTIAAIAVNQLVNHWDDLSRLWKGNEAVDQAQQMEEFAAAAEKAAKAVEGLRSGEDSKAGTAFSKQLTAGLKAGETGQDFEDALLARYASQRMAGGTGTVNIEEARAQIQQMLADAKEGSVEAAAQIANITFGAKEGGILGRFNAQGDAARAAERAGMAAGGSANVRRAFEQDIAGIRSGDDYAVVMDRLNRAFAEGRLSEEDYAAALERANAVKEQAADAAEKSAELERKEAAAKLKAAEATQNAIQAAALEAEQKAALANYDRRVDKRADVYGQMYGGGIAQAQYAAALRGEDQETTDERLRGQLMARMRNVAPELRRGTADEIIKRSRMMAEDYAIQVGAQRDLMGSALGEQAVRGDQRTFIGQMSRQQALAAGRAMGIDVNAYGKDIEAAAPTKAAEEQMKAAKIIYDAAKVIERVQVTI